jgi:hypothetical protein
MQGFSYCFVESSGGDMLGDSGVELRGCYVTPWVLLVVVGVLEGVRITVKEDDV